MRIFYTVVDNFDGSASVQFFDNPRCIELLEEHDPDAYGMGQGGGSFDVNGIVSGMHIRDLNDVYSYLVERLGIEKEFIDAT